jgi:hypothetical protein
MSGVAELVWMEKHYEASREVDIYPVRNTKLVPLNFDSRCL